MALGHDDPDDRAAWVRERIYLWWGREYVTAAEQTFWNAHLAQHGSDVTLAAIYDHANGQTLRAKRGW